MPESEIQGMSEIANFFAMGGYAEYVWSAYGIAALALTGLLAWVIMRTRALERRAAALRRPLSTDEHER